MKISLNWLKDYVDVPDAQTVVQKLTMSGLEVEAVEDAGAALRGVVAAKVLTAEKHPKAEKLSVTTVDCGRSAPLQIVCGAKNFKVGDVVPLATVGSTLPNGMSIGAAKLRDVESFGMLCSAKELGLSEDSAGLLILDNATVPGTPIADVLGLNDTLLTLNVTPNRGDALSMLGVAREVSALLGRPLKRPENQVVESQAKTGDGIRVEIADPSRCLRYAARIVDQVKNGPSPDWMAARLKAAGVRPISLVVDVTNYVMLECGQPLHGFDLKSIGTGAIVVRTAKPNEKLVTLDEKTRSLDEGDLLITNGEKPLVLAGVMGGLDSGVTAETQTVLLESAIFAPETVRRSAKRHQLHSESSHRFERGIDSGQTLWALNRAASLLAQLGQGSVRSGVVDKFPSPPAVKVLTLRFSQVERMLGMALSEQRCVEILSGLGFEKVSGNAIEAQFKVPPHRNDVSIEVDLIEELVRIHGYDTVPTVLPPGPKTLSPEKPAALTLRVIRQALSACGMDEVINYSFISAAEVDAFAAEADVAQSHEGIHLENPLSVEQAVMRTSLFPGLLANVKRAQRFGSAGARLYELGRTYEPNAKAKLSGKGESEPPAIERETVSGVLWGSRMGGRHWTQQDGDKPVDFYDAKAVVEATLEALQARRVSFVPMEGSLFHPRAAAWVKRGDEILGKLGELHPLIAKKLEVPSPVFLFELWVDTLLRVAVPQAQPLPKFPAVLRDLAVVVPSPMPVAEVEQVLREVGQPLVVDVNVFDVYEGEQVGAGKKNVAFALTYRSPDKTLTVEEVNAAHQRIVAQVSQRLGGALR
jgi:phenylalanyl-tRNA synthetase beta chain